MKELQAVKLTQSYPVVIDSYQVATIPANSKGILLSGYANSDKIAVQFDEYIVFVNPDHLTTPAKEARKAGYETLQQVSDLLGTKPDEKPVVSRETLRNWFFNKHFLFNAVLRGAKGKNDE